MIVVPVKPIRHRRLRRDRFDRRMPVDAGHRGVEARIRDTVDADAAIVVRHVLDQPIDRVVSVGRLINLVALLVRDVGPHIFINALAHVPAAHVLVNEDVAFARKQFVRPKEIFVCVRSIRPDAIGRTIEHDRILLFLVLRFVDAREELHAITHRNHYFALGVMALDVVG